MAWTSPRTWANGLTVTAAMLNAEVRDNLLALRALPCVAVRNATTTLTTSGTSELELLAVSFTAETGRLYRLAGGASLDGSAADDLWTLRLSVDGSSVSGYRMQTPSSPGEFSASVESYPKAYTAGSRSASLRVQRVSGTGTATTGGLTYWIAVYDCGG